MVDIQVVLENEPKADLRRSYESGRRRYLNGDMSRGWKPEYDYHEFERFDQLLSDAGSRMVNHAKIALAETYTNGIQHLRLNLIRKAKMGANVIGEFNTSLSSKENAVVNLPATLMFGLYSPKATYDCSDKIYTTIGHEVRHHVDLDFLLYCSELYDEIKSACKDNNSRNKPVSFMTNADLFLSEYLLELRGEGFAEFDGTIDPRPQSMNLAEYFKIFQGECKSSPRRVETLMEKTRERTETVTKVFDFLSGKNPIFTAELIYAIGNKMTDGENPLSIPVRLCPYDQGGLMFQIMGLAEYKRQREECTGHDAKLEDLLIALRIPKGIVKNVTMNVLEKKTIGEFFDMYYKDAEFLGLDEDHCIIRREYAQNLIDIESAMLGLGVTKLVKAV